MTRTRRLMTTPGVGAIVALTYASAIDDPARFRSSKHGGGAFRADAEEVPVRRDRLHRPDLARSAIMAVRMALYEAAHVMLTRPVKGCAI